jgi:integrase
MSGKQAKTLSDDNIKDLLIYAECTRHPVRNQIIVLLSAKAGLRAGEIAKLTWDMILDARSLAPHDQGYGPGGAVRAWRSDEAAQYRGLVLDRLQCPPTGRLLLTFRTSHVHHSGCPVGP